LSLGEPNFVEWIIEKETIIISKKASKMLQSKQSFFRSFAESQKQEDLDLDHPYYENSIVELCLRIIEDVYFNAFIFLIIIANTVILALDKYPEHDPDVLAFFKILNLFFTIVFTVELVFKFIALGVRAFFRDGFNIFDMVIVFTSV
jgi:hypothetical protein